MFRRFEFRSLLNRVDELDEARARRRSASSSRARRSAWREGDVCSPSRGTVGRRDRRRPDRRRRRRAACSSPPGSRPSRRSCATREIVAHDAKALTLPFAPVDDTMLAAYLIEPGRAAYLTRRPRRRVRHRDRAATRGRGGDDRDARPPRRGDRGGSRARCASGSSSAASLELYERIELPLTAVLAAMEDAGVKIDTYRMGEITARLRDRVEELEAKAYRARGRGVHARLDAAGRAGSSSRSSASTPGRKGKTGYSTDSARAARDLRDEHEIVARDRGVARATRSC